MNSGEPRTHKVAETGLKLTVPCLSFMRAAVTAVHHPAQSTCFLFFSSRLNIPVPNTWVLKGFILQIFLNV